MKYPIPICSDHYVTNTWDFLIRRVYNKIWSNNNELFAISPDCYAWLIIHALLIDFSKNFSAKLEDFEGYERFYLSFYMFSSLIGFVLLRFWQAVEQPGESICRVSNPEFSPNVGQRSLLNYFLSEMENEYDLLYNATLAGRGLFDIAVDDETDPHILALVPCTSEEAAKNIIRIRLIDTSAEWSQTFQRVISKKVWTMDWNGWEIQFDEDLIPTHYELFCQAWKETFGVELEVPCDQFIPMRRWLKWIFCPTGFTKTAHSHVRYFTEYQDEELGFELDDIFCLLDGMLPDLDEVVSIISLKNIAKGNFDYKIQAQLADIAWGFKIKNPTGAYTYFLPVREWFINKLQPVLLRFARLVKVVGDSFEEDLHRYCTLYSRKGIELEPSRSSLFGSTIKFGSSPQKMIKAIREISEIEPLRILEKNMDIIINPQDKTEIDLIIMGRNHLYFLESKAINLEDNRAIKYLRTKAPEQCAKYVAWLINEVEFEKFLRKHKINKKMLRSVRVIIVTCGVIEDFIVKDLETGLEFAVVPATALFHILAGVTISSVGSIFPKRVFNIFEILQFQFQNIKKMGLVDRKRELTRVADRIMRKWQRLATFDWRNVDNQKALAALNEFQDAEFLGITRISFEDYLTTAPEWILPTPKYLGSTGGYKFYIGTGLGQAGSSFICPNCKSVIKYYLNPSALKKLHQIFSAKKCPFCAGKMQPARKHLKFASIMSSMILRMKRKLGRYRL